MALITGAGGGIGRACAVAFGRAGFRLVLAGRTAESLALTAAEVGGSALAVPTDVTDPASVAALFATIETSCGRLDVLFNNAGVDVPGVPLEEVTFAIWSKILATNVTGQFLCAQAAFSLMRRQRPKGGRIINNGSVAARAPRPNSIPYSTSKHAVTGLTKGLMLDGRPHAIAASQIDIGNAAEDPDAPRAPARQADGSLAVEPAMGYEAVASTVLHMATLPAGANAAFVTVMATAMPLFGRG